MHKLSLYINDDRLEKIKHLTGETNLENIEEFINNAVYDGIEFAWLQKRGEDIKKMLEAGDDETKFVTIDGIKYEIWSDGDMAVITEDDKDAIVQLVAGHLHFVLENGNLIRCQDETHERLMKALETAKVALNDYKTEDLEDNVIA